MLKKIELDLKLKLRTRIRKQIHLLEIFGIKTRIKVIKLKIKTRIM